RLAVDEASDSGPPPVHGGTGRKAPGDPKALAPQILARVGGYIDLGSEGGLQVVYEEREEKTYRLPAAAQIKVENGQYIRAGDQLTEGSVNPQDILRVLGREAVQSYLVAEVQKV